MISLDVKAIVNVLAGSLGLAPEEAILKATLKMLIASISRLLMKMKRSMILKTSITRRMKSWTKPPLSLKPKGREAGFNWDRQFL